jgi:hypothetical protein
MGDRVAMYATVASRFGAERADLLQKVSTTGNVGVHDDLAAECDVILVSRIRDSATYSGRGIPASCVARPSNTPGILGRRALLSGRRAPEYLSPNL